MDNDRSWLRASAFILAVTFVGVCSHQIRADDDAKPAKKKTKSKPSANEWPTTSAPSTDKTVETPQVEWFVPSLTRLSEAAKRSRTAKLLAGLAPLIETPRAETDEDFDVDALLKLLTQIRGWPDTSLSARIFTQDTEGRPRWTLRIDWPMAQSKQRIELLLKDPAAKKVLGEVQITALDGDRFQLALADVVLAVVGPCKGGSVVASSVEMKLTPGTLEEEIDPKDADAPLLLCRYNIGASGDDEDSGSPFGSLTGIRDIQFETTVDKQGRWSEQWNLGWNPLFGIAAKSMVKRVARPFDQPRDSLVLAAFNAEPTTAMADGMSGLPRATLAPHIGSEMALAVSPGTGFLPVPDVFFQWNVRSRDKLLAAIRKAIEIDDRKRTDDDRRIAWHEISVDGREAFWFDPGANEGGGLRPWVTRTVLFLDGKIEGEGAKPRLVIAQTSTSAEDAVRRWKQLRRGASASLITPDNTRAHWQAVVHWKRVYALAQPWLAVLAGFSEDASPPPTASELDDALCDSVIDVRIEFGGLTIRHSGPLPFGAAYVPAITAMALGQGVGWASESAREQTACENLRVLHHHSKLFRKDFGRWPSAVAELDGYIDFTSHPYLLALQPKDRGIIAGVVSLVRKDRKKATKQADEDRIDDSLFVIRGANETTWNISIRPNEFKRLSTIRIDTAGKIEKVKAVVNLAVEDAKDKPAAVVKKTATTQPSTRVKKSAPKPVPVIDQDDDENEEEEE